VHRGAIIHIEWSDRKLAKSCMTDANGQKRFGPQRWKLLRRRIATLQAAQSLSDIRGVGGFHQLTADYGGSFAVNLDGPYRLVFKPDHDPLPTLAGGGVDEAAITRVVITEVVNYHG
jgi:proteic killer suppression protein